MVAKTMLHRHLVTLKCHKKECHKFVAICCRGERSAVEHIAHNEDASEAAEPTAHSIGAGKAGKSTAHSGDASKAV